METLVLQSGRVIDARDVATCLLYQGEQFYDMHCNAYENFQCHQNTDLCYIDTTYMCVELQRLLEHIKGKKIYSTFAIFGTICQCLNFMHAVFVDTHTGQTA